MSSASEPKVTTATFSTSVSSNPDGTYNLTVSSQTNNDVKPTEIHQHNIPASELPRILSTVTKELVKSDPNAEKYAKLYKSLPTPEEFSKMSDTDRGVVWSALSQPPPRRHHYRTFSPDPWNLLGYEHSFPRLLF